MAENSDGQGNGTARREGLCASAPRNLRSGASRVSLVAVALAASMGWSGAAGAAVVHEGPKKDAVKRTPTTPDRMTRALQERILGKASLDDVRVHVYWSRSDGAAEVDLFGNGIGVWRRSHQFRLSKADVLSILSALQKARFGAMPDRFGEDPEVAEARDLVRLKGSIVLTVGTMIKGVSQLGTGEQSKECESLAAQVLKICEGPGQKGTGAASLADGLQNSPRGRFHRRSSE